MTLGQGSTCWPITTIPRSHRMVNKSMRCAAKAAGSAEMILRSASAEEANTFTGADKSPYAVPAAQPAAVAAVSSRGELPHDIGDYDLDLIYFGESDKKTNAKTKATKTETDVARPEPTKSDSRSAISLAERSDIFGSSDESDASSPRRSRSLESD